MILHDLEAFYWSLLYVILSRTVHTAPITYKEVFWSRSSKLSWLREHAPAFTVKGNAPLTHLMRALSVLVLENAEENGALEHDGVLALFDEVLSWGNWPTRDDGPVQDPEDATKGVAEMDEEEEDDYSDDDDDDDEMDTDDADRRRRERPNCKCAQSRRRRALRVYETESSIGSSDSYLSEHVFDGNSEDESDDDDMDDGSEGGEGEKTPCASRTATHTPDSVNLKTQRKIPPMDAPERMTFSGLVESESDMQRVRPLVLKRARTWLEGDFVASPPSPLKRAKTWTQEEILASSPAAHPPLASIPPN